MKRFKRIIKYFLDDIASFFPYFLVFYVVSLISASFFDSWNLFFSWGYFHYSIVILGVLSLLSEKFRLFIFSLIINNCAAVDSLKKITVSTWRGFFRFVVEIFKSTLIFIPTKTRRLISRAHKKDFVKTGLILAILIYAFVRHIEIIDFLVLFFALVSTLFVWNSRIAGGGALILLVACAVLLGVKKEAVAEVAAVYAYYFLVITVITQIGEYREEQKLSKNKAKSA